MPSSLKDFEGNENKSQSHTNNKVLITTNEDTNSEKATKEITNEVNVSNNILRMTNDQLNEIKVKILCYNYAKRFILII